ncbi:MAG: hypothetical protein ACI4EM_01455 [Hominisplanchenecus sp.]|nr:hypothetical protein [Lachnospiraceae bacterium]
MVKDMDRKENRAANANTRKEKNIMTVFFLWRKESVNGDREIMA